MSISVREPTPKEEIRIHSNPAAPPQAIHQHAWRHFWRHFLEMTVVMVIGMFAAASVLMITLNVIVEGEITWEQALVDYPVPALLAVAIGMSVPMIPWMRHRGHGRRSANEMALAMAVPVIPFVCLALFDVVKGADCGLYCLIGFVAMLALMIYRRDQYGINAPFSRILARFNRNIVNPFVRLFAGWVPPFSIVIHRGRRSGNMYRTPAWAFRTKDGLIFAALYGANSDWIKNVVADDRAEVKRLGRSAEYGAPRLVDSSSSMRRMPATFRPVFRFFHTREFLRVEASYPAGGKEWSQ